MQYFLLQHKVKNTYTHIHCIKFLVNLIFLKLCKYANMIFIKCDKFNDTYHLPSLLASLSLSRIYKDIILNNNDRVNNIIFYMLIFNI